MRLEPIGRRAALRALLAVAPATLLTQQSQPASAFANSLPPDELMLKYPSPKTPGPKPGDIGPRDGGALKPCIDGKPHCFSSSAENFDDEFNAGELPEDWLVDPFRFDKPPAEAMADLKEAVAAYPPGQRGIDGGGFEIITSTPEYLYVQFQSLRKGYIDDMEFSLAAKTGVCNVRTSSRLGYLDLGVNAKRYAWFAERLGKTAGWKTVPLKAAKHGEYFSQNNLRDSDLVAK